MRFLIALSILLPATFPAPTSSLDFKGIWIPKAIDWSNPRFETYCFLNDTTVIVISSIQKQEGDSISFCADNSPTVTTRFVNKRSARRLLIFGVKPNAGVDPDNTKIDVTFDRDFMEMQIHHITYERGLKYTFASKQAIYELILQHNDH